MKRLMNCAFVGTLVALCACASTTQVTARWERPNYVAPGLKKIAVVAWSDKKNTRISIENYIISELAELGIKGVALNDLFVELPTPDKVDVIRERLQGLGVDGAISLRLMSRSFKEKTVTGISANERYESNFYESYAYFFNPVYGDTTVDLETTYSLESTLYALDGRGPIAIREISLKKTNLIEELEDGSRAIVTALNDAGALTGKKK